MLNEPLTIKEAILIYVEKFRVVSFEMIFDMLDEAYMSDLPSVKVQALSELVQANEIRRIEYTAKDRSDIRSFFMISESRLLNV